MAKPRRLTFGQLRQFLLSLGFVEGSADADFTAFRHADSDTVLVFPKMQGPGDPVPSQDLVSARQHLQERGLIDALDFDRLVSGHELSPRDG